MARKKKATRRRSYRKKARRSKPPAKPAGFAGGAAISAFEVLGDPVKYALAQQYTNAQSSLKANATNLSNYKFALGGALLSGSKGMPGIRLVAGPVDRAIRALTRGKWGL